MLKTTKIEAGEIHIWKVDIPECLSEKQELFSYLPEQEAYRASRYRFEKDYNKYVITRGLLRSLLGQYLNEKPHKITIEYNFNGKPFVNNYEGLNFNLSHTEDFSLIAFTVNQEIGIDVELTRNDINFDGIVEASFTKDEISRIMQISTAKKVELFYKIWTRKEALIKAKGISLARVIDGSEATDPFDETDWFITSFKAKKLYQAALASNKNSVKIRFCN